jgi:hypothetical protein
VKIYDLEQLLSDIQSLLSQSFNAKLTMIDAEKADGVILKPIDSRAYFIQELNSKSANFNPFVFIGVTNIESKPLLSGTAASYTINVGVVLADSGNDVSIVKRMFRYARAMKETIEENFFLEDSAISLEVEGLIPAQFQDLNSSQSYRVVGVDIVATLA